MRRILVQRHYWVIFFENEQGEAFTVNGDCYRALLNEFLFTKIDEEDIVFEDRIISRRADDVWSPRSCDLTPLDYYLWGAKDKSKISVMPTCQRKLTL